MYISYQVHLTEAASESVYMTKDALTALVKRYHSQLEAITKKLQQDQPNLSTGDNTCLYTNMK